MISKISLFNKGIYKSTLKRYLWGSVLYFILLFMITGMSILLSYDKNIEYLPSRGPNWSLIMDNEFILLPILLAIAVPTVVGLMIFRFIHSKKTSVFVHSLPVKREANYVSSVLAALTLMAMPVIFNTLVLMIISASGYSQYFCIGDCAVWMLFNLFALFIMFSCVCFVASITGNSFAMIVLNILFHTFAPLLAAGFSIVSEKFLFGYAGEDAVLSHVVDNNFPARLMSIVSTWAFREQGFNYATDVVKFIVIALVLYAVSAILYKKRRMETAEDVAGFKCLNPILKYLVTFMGAIAAFSIFSYSMQDNQFVFWCIVVLCSFVIYFAGEMLLKKTFKVWHTYKGYIGFAAVFAAMICVFAFTSFFGFESYIPEKDDVAKIALYNYYRGDKPYTDNEDIMAKAQIIHHDMIAKKDIIKKYTYDTNIHIEYELRNGKTVHRTYGISQDELHDIMEAMYKNEEYKKQSERIFTPMESVYSINIYSGNENAVIEGNDKMQELVECIKADVSQLNYNKLYCNGWGFNIEIEYIPVVKEDVEHSYRVVTAENEERSRLYIDHISVNVNSNHKHTLQWLRENGYWEKINIKNTGVMYICKDWKDLPFVNEEGIVIDEIDTVKENKIIKIETPEDIQKMIDYAQSAPQEYSSKKDRYTVYHLRDKNTMACAAVMDITKEDVLNLFPARGWENKFAKGLN